MLLTDNAGVNLRDSDGRTPLYSAAKAGRLDMMEALIASGAMVGMRGEKSLTPLHAACEQGDPKVLEQVMTAGALVGHCWNDALRSPLHVACACGNTEAIRRLLPSLSARQLNMRDRVRNEREGGDTPLLLAVQQGSETAVRMVSLCEQLHRLSNEYREAREGSRLIFVPRPAGSPERTNHQLQGRPKFATPVMTGSLCLQVAVTAIKAASDCCQEQRQIVPPQQRDIGISLHTPSSPLSCSCSCECTCTRALTPFPRHRDTLLPAAPGGWSRREDTSGVYRPESFARGRFSKARVCFKRGCPPLSWDRACSHSSRCRRQRRGHSRADRPARGLPRAWRR